MMADRPKHRAPSSPRPRRSRLAAFATALVLAPSLLYGQSVLEVQAGGMSLYDSYGAAVYAYTNRFTGWAGIGYQDGLLFGAGIQTTFRQDTLRLGSSALVERYTTDLFTPGVNVLTQDARYTWVRPNTVVMGSVGFAAETPGSQFFPAFSFDDAYGALKVKHQVERRVRVAFDGVVSGKQTAIAHAAFLPTPTLGLAAAAGIGSNVPYGAVSLEYQGRTVKVLASYIAQADGFRRVDLPFPNQTEADRENIQVDWQVRPFLAVGAARQNFLQNGRDSLPPVRGTGNSIYASAHGYGFRTQAGLYDSESMGISNLSSYFMLGRSFGSWFDAEVFVLQSRPSVGPSTTTPIVNLREHVTQRLALTQQVAFNPGHVTVQFGGNLVTPIGEVGVGYQIVQRPLQPLNPFESVLSLTARLQLGRYSTSLNTIFQPDGSVSYVANASTFLYFGEFGGAAQSNLIGKQMGKFVLRGRVVDDAGQPVDGAAIELDGQLAFTNTNGEFLVRVGRPRTYQVRVLLQEFLTPGTWEVVRAPDGILAVSEEGGSSAEIVLRRGASPLPTPAPSDSTVPPR